MIIICGKTLDEVYEQLAIIEDSMSNGAVCGMGISETELDKVVDLVTDILG